MRTCLCFSIKTWDATLSPVSSWKERERSDRNQSLLGRYRAGDGNSRAQHVLVALKKVPLCASLASFGSRRLAMSVAQPEDVSEVGDG